MFSLSEFSVVRLSLIDVRRRYLPVLFGGLFAVPIFVSAQAVPDAGSIQRDLAAPPLIPSPKFESAPIPESNETTQNTGAQFSVDEFVVSGVSLMSADEVDAALSPWVGREVYFSELQQALDAVNLLYADNGWLARTQFPVQDVVDGRVMVEVLEARFGRLETGSAEDLPISENRVFKTLMPHMSNSEMLSVEGLNLGLNQLNSLPGVSLQAALAAGEQDGSIDILISSGSASTFTGSFLLDNWGHASTGSERLSVNFNINNPSHSGDQLSVNLMSSEAVHYGRLGYSVPLGYAGGRLSVGASQLEYKLIGDFAILQSLGDANTLTAEVTRPLLSSASSGVTLALGYSSSNYLNEANGTVVSEKSLQASSLSVYGYWLSDSLNPSLTQWSLGLNAGDLDLSDNLDNQEADAEGLGTAGNFEKLNLSLSHIKPLSQNSKLIVSLAGQYAEKNLDSSQKFSLGGPRGMRAHPSSEGAGDDGLMLNIELETALSPATKLSVFYDMGEVRLSKNPIASGLATPNKYSLRGWGVTASRVFGRSSALKLTLGRRIGSNPAASETTGNDNDGTLKENRLWLSWVSNF